MNDINYELRKAYYTLLNGVVVLNGTPVNIYYSQLPADLNKGTYILINDINSIPLNSDEVSRTITNITLQIVTKRPNNNDGFDNDEVAYQIYAIIYPSPRTKAVQISNGQVINTTLQADNVITGLTDGANRVINRVITFQHIILHYPYTYPPMANIYYGVQDYYGIPAAFNQKIIANAELPFEIPFGAQTTAKFFWIATPLAKTEWQDIYDEGNAGDIGGITNLFENTNIIIFGEPYVLQMTQYATDFTDSNQLKFS